MQKQHSLRKKKKKKSEVYSVQFKLDVLSFRKRTGASFTETTLHFGLTNPPLIASWNKKLLEGGAEALDKPKGWPAKSDKAKNSQRRKQPKKKTACKRDDT